MLVSRNLDHRKNFSRTKALADALSLATPASDTLPNHGPYLLRFYAVESGLKYLLNQNAKVPFSYEVDDLGFAPDTSVPGFPQKIEKYSHDLPRMLARLNV